MAQNLVSLQMSPEQLSAMDGALNALEQALAGLVALTPDDRRRLTKMGEKSEVFCRQTLRALANNPQIVPPSLDIAEAIRDFDAIDLLRPRMQRLSRLAERATDTETALGADLMVAALEGYALLKVSGKAMGLDGLRKELGSRWVRGKRGSGADEEAAEAEAGA